MAQPNLSVVIPVYNEEAGLPALFARLYPALDQMRMAYEVIFVNDGSHDRSAAILRQQFERRPDVTRVVLFNANYGQHLAIMAGFQHSRGARVVTLDADLQNPPEEIGKLLAKMDEGYDYVGGVRAERHDTWFRRNASRIMNRLRERTTRIHMTDQGCMLRAYDRQVVDAINRCEEVNTFIPALAYTFSSNPTEVEVAHEERAMGTTKYSLYKLVRLNFDLVTGFSLAPLQAFSLVGFVLAASSTGVVVFQIFHRLVRGDAAEGMFQSVAEAVQFFLFGVVLFGIGLLGEYIGRIYQEVLRRPRFIVSAVLERQATEEASVSGPPLAAHKTPVLR
jgi:undecaprenyl-phosphate 4-deoxy-4-formamido-L-arabinose transferase